MALAPSQSARRAGFRRTALGILPEDWKVCTFGELFDFRNGVNAVKEAYGKGTRFINVLEVIEHEHIRTFDIPGRVVLSRQAINQFVVRRGDLLFNRTSETQDEVGLASVFLSDDEVVFGGFVIRARPKSGCLDPIYSGYAFRTHAIRSQIVARGQGAIRANIGQADLRQVLAPVPPIEEQRAIAVRLADIDAEIVSLQELIAKKRHLKTATMQQLLTGKRRLPDFTGEWEAKYLRDLGTFSKGKGIRKDDVRPEGIPCIRYGEIYTHHSDYIRTFNSFISRQVARESQLLRKGDLLFSGSGETAEEIGKCVAFLGEEEAYAGSDTVIFSPTNQDSTFLGYLMNHASVTEQKSRLGQGDAVVHISATNLGQIRLRLPEKGEQVAIASILRDLDAEITTTVGRRDKARALKQGMMQQLLAGKIRLI